MKKKLENRLQKLKSEFATGKKRLTEIESQRSGLHETLLRISGAIQVLEEELGENSKQGNGSPNQKEIESVQKLANDHAVDAS